MVVVHVCPDCKTEVRKPFYRITIDANSFFYKYMYQCPKCKTVFVE